MSQERPIHPQTVHGAGRHESAPDGSTIYPLVRTDSASAGLIVLEPGEISKAIMHRTVEEIWYVLEGRGQIWRSSSGGEQLDDLLPGTCVSIPADTAFQFCAAENEPLRVLMITVPPWPGEHEAVDSVGYWEISPS